MSSDTRPFDSPEDSVANRGREPVVHPDRVCRIFLLQGYLLTYLLADAHVLGGQGWSG